MLLLLMLLLWLLSLVLLVLVLVGDAFSPVCVIDSRLILFISVCGSPPVPGADWRAVVQWCALPEISEPLSVPDAGDTCGPGRLSHSVLALPHRTMEQSEYIFA
eukprot:GHVL01000338.1.p1 GENE.GHVL01000338.1~~GHVL01000338.1.p1  ORF type:complete len:104 (-),score=14.62 GHVL01000338.1:227-538(-)